MGRSVKYMGTADVRIIPKGTNFGGQLKEEDAVQKEVVFNADNFWTVDSDEAGLTDEQVDLLLEDKEAFKDVSDLKRIPANRHQSTFLGMKVASNEEAGVSDAQAMQDAGTTGVVTASVSKSAGSSRAKGTGTTVGGST